MKKKYDYLIIGSGAGGATLARELARKHRQVLVLEKGDYELSYGTALDSYRFLDGSRLTQTPKKSIEGITLLRAFMAGGSAFLSSGNFTRCLDTEFKEFGINLDREYREAESEINPQPLPAGLISESTQKLAAIAADTGYRMVPLQKCIDPKKCVRCGMCTFGCQTGAKWTPLKFLDEALMLGAEIRFGTIAEKIVQRRGKTSGVIIRDRTGRHQVLADTIILSAGGLGTPLILQASGIKEAGSHLFIDTYVSMYGSQESFGPVLEPLMSMGMLESLQKEGFWIASYFMPSDAYRLIEAGTRGLALPSNHSLGLLTRITDEATGHVLPNGTVSKRITPKDREKLAKGIRISKEILVRAGVNPARLVKSSPAGSHLGGTAGIGRIVDANLETQISNLFVCDASVFPQAPGLSAMLPLIALAKRLAKFIG